MSAALPVAVSADWLAARLETGDPDLVVADCRFQLGDPGWGVAQYRTGHIPGAVHLDLDRHLSGPVAVHGGRHPLPTHDVLGATFATAGITRGRSTVIAYDDNRLAFAARLWWLLHYCGHDRVAVLDGGWTGWLAAGGVSETRIPDPPPGEFRSQIQAERCVDIAGMRARQGNPHSVSIDSREPRRYRGEWEPIDPIAGHIPGAVNLPWQEVTDDRGYLQPASAQRARWQPYENATEIVAYCGSGVTACVNLISLEVAGLPPGKLYAGSWSDWCSYD